MAEVGNIDHVSQVRFTKSVELLGIMLYFGGPEKLMLGIQGKFGQPRSHGQNQRLDLPCGREFITYDVPEYLHSILR